MKSPPAKRENAKKTLSQNIEKDVHAPEDTSPPDEKYLRRFTEKMCQLKTDTPVILPLFKKIYSNSEADTDLHEEPAKSIDNKAGTGIMDTKLREVMRNPNISTEEVASLLSFSDAERNHVDTTTSKQWQCEEWYLHKAGFITASKCKRVFTRQETLDKNKEENVIKLVQDISVWIRKKDAIELPLYSAKSGHFFLARNLQR